MRGEGSEHGFLAIERGHEPVLQVDDFLDVPGAVQGEALAVGQQLQAGVVQRRADRLALGQPVIEVAGEAFGGLHQHAVVHGHDRADARLDQPGRDAGEGVALVGRGGLAGVQHHQRDAALVEQRAQLLGVDVVALLPVVLEEQEAQTHRRVVDAVAVEVDHVDGRRVAVAQPGVERGQGGRAQELHRHRVAQRVQRVQQRRGRAARVDEARARRPADHHQQAHRRLEGTHAQVAAAVHAPAHVDRRLFAEQVAALVGQQLPGQAQDARLGGVHDHGGRLRAVAPAVETLPQAHGRGRTVEDRVEQGAAQAGQASLQRLGAVVVRSHRPERVALDVPAQVGQVGVRQRVAEVEGLAVAAGEVDGDWHRRVEGCVAVEAGEAEDEFHGVAFWLTVRRRDSTLALGATYQLGCVTLNGSCAQHSRS